MTDSCTCILLLSSYKNWQKCLRNPKIERYDLLLVLDNWLWCFVIIFLYNMRMSYCLLIFFKTRYKDDPSNILIFNWISVTAVRTINDKFLGF